MENDIYTKASIYVNTSLYTVHPHTQKLSHINHISNQCMFLNSTANIPQANN